MQMFLQGTGHYRKSAYIYHRQIQNQQLLLKQTSRGIELAIAILWRTKENSHPLGTPEIWQAKNSPFPEA